MRFQADHSADGPAALASTSRYTSRETDHQSEYRPGSPSTAACGLDSSTSAAAASPRSELKHRRKPSEVSAGSRSFDREFTAPPRFSRAPNSAAGPILAR